ncbi:hypothetical protein [Leekyejoonella antrihumi]|uniref:Uncharacterized protein n=1 Tax=Leekyejoonella antrihumi TaxID=1660198 RepID=A0A563E154_9MICO|nr:hypothetical protein [Leekyejoonella antrihumi]TWP35941.1 hypothetical protein FGL98_11965 [Leekyejoonella antrihumi]
MNATKSGRRAALRSTWERGAATLETTGMLALAALLVLAVAASLTVGSSGLGAEVKTAICEVVTLGQGSCDYSPQAQAHVPKEPCVMSSQNQQGTVSASFVVTLSGGESALIEKLSDGTYRVTTGETGGVGWQPGVGFDVTATYDGNKYGASAAAGLNIEASFTGGNVYIAHSQADVGKLMRAFTEKVAVDGTVGSGGPLHWATNKFLGLIGKRYTLPTPDSTYVEGGVQAGGSASATAGASGASASASVAAGLGYQRNKDGSTVTYYKASVSGAAQGQLVGNGSTAKTVEAGAGGQAQVLTQVVRNTAGKITSVRVQTVVAGDASATGAGDHSAYRKSTVELPIRNGADAAVANNFLMSQGIDLGGSMLYAPIAKQDPSGGNQMQAPIAKQDPSAGGHKMQVFNTSPAGPPNLIDSTEQFVQAARDHGYDTRQDFQSQAGNEYGFSLGGKFLGKFGASGDYATSGLKATNSQYWNGAQWASWPGC